MRFRRNPSLVIASTLVLLAILLPVSASSAFTTNPNISSDPDITRPLVWVSGQDVDRVFVVDTGAAQPFKTFDFAHGCSIVAPATACTTDSNVPTILGVGANTPGDNFSSGKPHLITFSPDARFAYVTFQNTNPGKVVVIDTVTLKVVDTITINESVVPSTAALRVTEAQQSALDPSVMLVGLIGTPNPGFLVKVDVNETALTWTVDTSAPAATGMTTEQGPGCIQFSPTNPDLAYYDSTLSPALGVGVINPTTMTYGEFDPTVGDVQCGFHEPITVGGNTSIVVTDSGTAFNQSQASFGDLYTLNPNSATSFLSAPTQVTIDALNLHDNWPVQLEPDGAPTTFSPDTVFGSARNSGFLDTLTTGGAETNELQVTPPDLLTNGRGAIDTLDGSGDTVFAAMKESGDLGIIDDPGGASQAISFIHLANTDPSCVTASNGNFQKCFVVHALRVQPLEASTTTLTVTPTSPPFGKAVTLKAHVTSTVTNPDISPAGTVTFSVNGQAVDTATLHNGVATFTTAGLPAGPNSVTATYSAANQSLPGDTPIFGTSKDTKTVPVSATTLTGTQTTVIVGAGQSVLLIDANVTGSVIVQKGGSLDIEDSTIHGSVSATGSTALRMCDNTVSGSVNVSNAKGFVLIGDPGIDNCIGNTINGGVTLVDNTHGIVVLDNLIGGVITATGNSGAGPFPQQQPGPEIQ